MARNTLNFDASKSPGVIRRVIGTFLRGYGKRLSDAVEDGAGEGMQDAVDEWKRRATNLAPLKTGNLRNNITAEVDGDGKNLVGKVEASAITTRGRGRFDYAAYLQDGYPKKHGDTFKNPTTGGTIPRFIDKSGEELQPEIQRKIEAQIKQAIKARGL